MTARALLPRRTIDIPLMSDESHRAWRAAFHDKPWLARGQVPRDFPLPSAILDEAKRLATMDRVAFHASHDHGPWLRREVDARPYERLRADEVDGAIASEIALQMNGLEHLGEAPGDRVSALGRRIVAELPWAGPLGIAVTLSPAGARFDAHVDPAGALFVQAKGRKRYWVSEEPVVRAPTTKSFLFADGRLGEAQEDDADAVVLEGALREEVLEPGDVLYVPAGTLHRTEAITASEAYFYIFMQTPFASLLEHALMRGPSDDPAWRQRPLAPSDAWLRAGVDETIATLTAWKTDPAPLREEHERAIAERSAPHVDAESDAEITKSTILEPSRDPAVRV